jgi:ferredoxin
MAKNIKPRIRLRLPSTKAFTQEARKTEDYSFFDMLHGYVYLRWPYLYIGVGTGEHPLTRYLRPLANFLGKLFLPQSENGSSRKDFADTYHGKVVPLEAAAQLVSVQEDIRLTDLEHIIPYQRARDIILKNPDHIAVLECPCRASRDDPCLPLDVCLIIGEPFASLVAEHHPKRSRWISSGEAIEILQAEHERGHIHHAFFKDAMLERFYAICNCCSCCCGAMRAWQNGTPMLCSSGYVSRVDIDLCIQCDTCSQLCQFDALTLDQYDYPVVNEKKCMGCGVCVSHCPEEAFALLRDVSKSEPLVIEELITGQKLLN